MKKKKILMISITIIVLLLLVFGIMILTKDDTPIPNAEGEKTTEQEQELLSCLANELGARIATENSDFTDIVIDEVTTNPKEVLYYKGTMTNNENIYIIVKTSSSEVQKDINFYFSSKYSIYQTFSFNDNISVFLHNSLNDTTYNDLVSACVLDEQDKVESVSLPSNTAEGLNETTKIVIKSGSDTIGEIQDSEIIGATISSISSARMIGDHFNCDGHTFDLEMYNENNELIDTIHLWPDGKRLMPESLKKGCSYYSVSNSDIDFRKLIESETDYIFYTITDYSEECNGTLEPIYEDKDYIYYLACEKSDEVFISFNLSNQTMTLKYALNNNYITPQQLASYDELLIIEEK